MKTILILMYSCSCLSFISAQSGNDTMTNKKLIELTQVGFGPEVIIGFIKTTPTNLNCGMSEILNLKKENVSDKLIAEMMSYCNQIRNIAYETSNTNNPLLAHEPGIYAFDNDALKKLYPTVMTGVKAGGFGSALAQSYSMGLSPSNVKSQLSGSEANVNPIVRI